jgi:hypothetical protein
MDLTVLAYATLALSLFVSAIKMGGWILNADPRAILGRVRMSLEEALDVLGLDPTATPQEIREAHRRLEQKVVPERGGTHYLVTKINEARDVLLGE